MKYYSLIILVLFCLGSCKQSDNHNKQQSVTNQKTSKIPLPDSIARIISPLISLRDSTLNIIRTINNVNRADSMFIKFSNRYHDSFYNINSKLDSNKLFHTWIEYTSLDTLYESLSGRGFILIQSEGWPNSIGIDNLALLETYKPYISHPMVEFLSMLYKEEAKGFIDEGLLSISWKQLSERVARWDIFITANINFMLIEDAKYWYQTYLGVYLRGYDNSRVFSMKGDTLESVVKNSYLDFVKSYSSTNSARIVRSYLDVLARNGYRNCQEVQKFLKDNNINAEPRERIPFRLGAG